MIELFLLYYLKIRRFIEVMLLMFIVVNKTTEKREHFVLRFSTSSVLLFALYVFTKVYSMIVPESTWGVIAQLFNRDTLLMLILDILMFGLYYASYWDSVGNLMGKYVIGYSSYFVMNSIMTFIAEKDFLANGLTWQYMGIRTMVYLIVLSMTYWLIIRRCDKTSNYVLGGQIPSIVLYSLFFFITNLLHVFSLKIFFTSQIEYNYIALLIHMVVCINYLILLYMVEKHNRVKQDYQIISSIVKTQKMQYDLSKETVEIINRKCHDLKYQIEALKTVSDQRRSAFIEELAQSVNIYDGIARTENPVLNTILSEKGLICQKQNIQLSCIADSDAISFMDPVDVYVLIGNAISNAMEYLNGIDDVEKRLITFSVKRVAKTCLIRVDNYYQGSETMHTSDNLPLTTKPDKINHGYGLKSIRFTAKKYSGEIGISIGNNIFSLQIGIPIPE